MTEVRNRVAAWCDADSAAEREPPGEQKSAYIRVRSEHLHWITEQGDQRFPARFEPFLVYRPAKRPWYLRFLPALSHFDRSADRTQRDVVPRRNRVHRPRPFVWKAFERIAVILLATTALLALAVALIAVRRAWPSPARWFSTAGLVSALAGLVQLDHSGFFTSIHREYSDETKYPYGPPSYVTREIIANPETPIRTRILNIMFFHPRTGFHFILWGTLLQIIATWL
jgi:hypothetical protein